MEMLFRKENFFKEEIEVAKKYFEVKYQRTLINGNNNPIICRYNCLPHYQELEEDIKNMGGYMLNDFNQHQYIAQMGWIYDLEDLTFETYEKIEDIRGDFPLVVKGKTNSKKFQWKDQMFAQNKKQAIEIRNVLWNDSLLQNQDIVFRKYYELELIEKGINDMPMTNEWRIFFYKNNIIDYGFYWSIIDNLDLIDNLKNDFEKNGLDLAKQASSNIKDFTNFYAIDVAKTKQGKWMVVEINDGQMSGLSCINPDSFYKNLKNILQNSLYNKIKIKL